MSWRRTLILAILLVLLSGLYFWDRQQVQKEKAREEEEKKIFPWSVEQLTQAVVQRPQGKLLLTRGDGEQWLIQEPVQAKGEKESVRGFLESILKVRRDRKIADDAADLEPFGLVRPEYVITLQGKEPDGERIVHLGAKNPTEVYYYARVEGEKGVFLVSDMMRREADKKVFDLRDKTLLAYPPARFRELVLSSGEQSVGLRREGETQWRIVGPENRPADGDAVQSLLFRLSRLRAAAFEDEAAKSLSEMGLDPDRKRVVMRLQDPEEEVVLRLGSLVEGGQDPQRPRVYAQVDGASSAVQVEQQSVGEIPVDADGWRSKTLMVFERDKTERVELSRGTETLSIRKSGPNTWEIEEPEKLPADSMKVNDLMWVLKDGRAARFPKGEALPASWENPLVRVRLWAEGAAEPMELLVGEEAPGGSGYYVRAPAQEEVVLVAPKFVEELRQVSVQELRERRILSFDAVNIQRLQAVWEGQTLELVRKGDASWRKIQPQEGEMEGHRVMGLLWALRETRFEEILDRPPEPPVRGRGEPGLQVSLWADAKEPVASLGVGEELQDRPGSRYAWGGGESPVYVVGPKVMEELGRELKDMISAPPSAGGKR